jgi:hypothetical protein
MLNMTPMTSTHTATGDDTTTARATAKPASPTSRMCRPSRIPGDTGVRIERAIFDQTMRVDPHGHQPKV